MKQATGVFQLISLIFIFCLSTSVFSQISPGQISNLSPAQIQDLISKNLPANPVNNNPPANPDNNGNNGSGNNNGGDPNNTPNPPANAGNDGGNAAPDNGHNDPGPPAVYGQGFFRNYDLQFYVKSNQFIPPDSYEMGPGDVINIVIWGNSNFNKTYTIDEFGAINPFETGKITLSGLSFKNSKQILRNRFGEVFDLKNSQIDFSVTYSRVINVNIVGAVFNPGTYNIPAVNSAINALIASGGPTNTGSIRKIQIRRGGEIVQNIDIYKYLAGLEHPETFTLRNNDYIFVNNIQNVVSISGQVLRTGNYEMLENETLGDLLGFSGGLLPDASTGIVQVKRFVDNHFVYIDLKYDSLLKAKSEFALHGGDEVTILHLPRKIDNFVEIAGQVNLPGQYDFFEGIRISDLIKKAQGITTDAYLDRGYILRTKPDLTKEYLAFNVSDVLEQKNSGADVVLQNLDVVTIFPKGFFKPHFNIDVSGEVNNPGTYDYADGITLRDVLFYSGGFTSAAANERLEILRVAETKEGTVKINSTPLLYKTFNISPDLEIDKEAGKILLEPYDQIIVRRTPDFNASFPVAISGEVLYPGNYPISNKGERISDLMAKCGGLTNVAFLKDATLHRQSKETGFILLDLEKVLKNPNSKFNYLLEPGDELHIPKIRDYITIIGEVKFPDILKQGKINVPYSGFRAKRYIKKYGLGFNKQAKRSLTYVSQPGFQLGKVHKFWFINIYPRPLPGSTVVVQKAPYEPVLPDEAKQHHVPIDWNRFLENLTIKMTAIATLYILYINAVK